MLKSLAHVAVRKFEKLTFRRYVARDRHCGSDTFDFLIVDPVARAWYDSSADQGLPEKFWCRDHIKPGFHVVDCGAHHGMMSVLFSKWTGPAGRVTAYEIARGNREAMLKNLALNSCTNVTVRPFGVGDRSGSVSINALNGNAVAHVLNDGNAAVHRLPRLRSAKLVALDDDLDGRRVDFVKIDVEGSEVAALRGARRIISERCPILCLELHNFYFVDRRAALREIFSIASPRIYRFEILPDVLDPIRPLTDLDEVERYENPHVFCTPLANGD
jgi:FkbM family methyltransferase